jgi:hypothetical protein
LSKKTSHSKKAILRLDILTPNWISEFFLNISQFGALSFCIATHTAGPRGVSTTSKTYELNSMDKKRLSSQALHIHFVSLLFVSAELLGYCMNEPRNRGSVPNHRKIFSPRCVQTDPRSYPASCALGALCSRLVIRLHLVPVLRTHGYVPPLPHMPSWHAYVQFRLHWPNF